jgi:hypothetical protein
MFYKLNSLVNPGSSTRFSHTGLLPTLFSFSGDAALPTNQ